MKTTNLITLAFLFSLLFFACKKDPVHIIDTVEEAKPRIVDITGIYFGTSSGSYSDPTGNSSFTTPNTYLKVDTISLNIYQLQTFHDTLFTNPILSETFNATQSPIYSCMSYFRYDPFYNGPASLRLSSCDTLRFECYHAIGLMAASGSSFQGVKLPN